MTADQKKVIHGAMSKTIVSSATRLKQPVIEDTSDDNNSNVDGRKKLEYKMEIIWFNVVILTVLHVMAVYGVYLVFTIGTFSTVIFGYIYGRLGGIGITGGAHRLWSHRSYKATLSLRILLMLMQTSSVQTPIYTWVRDHRVHHKYTDTDADPHDSRRGFFFAHVGWLMMKKHPAVKERGKGVDMSDILNDPVVAFQMRHYLIIAPLLGFIIPTVVPMYFWGETFKFAFFFTIVRYTIILNFTWLVNSAAHMWGYKPYFKDMSPTENVIVSYLSYGEGFHNYHHVYPWDYKAAELGNYTFNVTKQFIDFFAWLGLAYDLKCATKDMVKKQAEKYGDGHWLQSEDDCNNTKSAFAKIGVF